MKHAGWLRSMMAKKMEPEAFCECVMESVYKEMCSWGSDVVLLYDWQGESDYMPVTLILDGRLVTFEVSKKEIEVRQHISSYSVDKVIWMAIEAAGVNVGNSPYVRYVWMQQ